MIIYHSLRYYQISKILYIVVFCGFICWILVGYTLCKPCLVNDDMVAVKVSTTKLFANGYPSDDEFNIIQIKFRLGLI